MGHEYRDRGYLTGTLRRLMLPFGLLIATVLLAGCGGLPSSAAVARDQASSKIPASPEGVAAQWRVLGNNPAAAGQFNYPMGLARGTNGSIWVADRLNHRLQELTLDGHPTRQIGSYGSGASQMQEPMALAAGRDGTLYAVQANSYSIVKVSPDTNRIERIDAGPASRTTTGFYLQGIAVAPSGDVYVYDSDAAAIRHLSTEGRVMDEWKVGSIGVGLRCSVAAGFPSGMRVDGEGHVYIALHLRGAVAKFDSDGRLLQTWPGVEEAYLGCPSDVEVDTQGSVYVAESGYNNVKKYSADGREVGSWDTVDPATGQEWTPIGLLLVDDHTLVVTDITFNTVWAMNTSDRSPSWRQVAPQQAKVEAIALEAEKGGGVLALEYSGLAVVRVGPTGEVVARWTLDQALVSKGARIVGIGLDISGEVLATAYSLEPFETQQALPAKILRGSRAGGALVEWATVEPVTDNSEPWLRDIVVDQQGVIYVCARDGRVFRLGTDGTVIAQWGDTRSRDWTYVNPGNMAVDPKGNVLVAQPFEKGILLLEDGAVVLKKLAGAEYVSIAVDRDGSIWAVDTKRQAIDHLSATFELLETFDTKGTRVGEFQNPLAVAVSADGDVYVADTGNLRIQVYGR